VADDLFDTAECDDLPAQLELPARGFATARYHGADVFFPAGHQQVQPAAQVTYQIESTVKYWLERLVAYRLQSSAWQDVEAGRLDEATRRLQMAGTRLFDAGEVALAQTVQEEATRLLRSGSTSDEGRKRIKFGTRGLMGRSRVEERETGT